MNDKTRRFIARKVHALRKERRWTQAELAQRLSQSRLSEIERGGGSFSAEQFLTILRLFNVTASYFADEVPDRGAEIQNALARFGALHLPSERLDDVGDVVREALVAPELPRLITAIAPVLVRNVDRLNLPRLKLRLAEAGLERRLAWVVENTAEAIRNELPAATSTPWAKAYRRALVVLDAFLAPLGQEREPTAPDVLDAGIRSKKTLSEVTGASSPISRRWGIVTSLQPDDFVEALRGARP